MEGSLMQRYLQCYHQLNLPSHSKTANKQLLQMEASFEAWSIAYQLISSDDQQLQLHGAQLLSKKLNSPPRQDVNLEAYLHFIMGKKGNNQVLWLCAAKIMVHLSPDKADLPNHLSAVDTIKLIKEIPAALAHIHTQTPFDSAKMKEEYLKLSLPLLVSQMRQNPTMVLQVIDSFVSYGAKIKDPILVSFLLSLPFEDGGHILEDIIGRQSFLQQQSQLLHYLQSHRSDDSALPLHISFFRSVDLSQLSFEDFRGSIEYILACLGQQDAEACTRVSQSYELWHGISKQLKEGKIDQGKEEIVKQAFMALWNIVCKRTILSQMPTRSVVMESSLAIDVDDDRDEDEDQDAKHSSVPAANKEAQHFRTYAGDFFMLCLQTLSVFPQTRQSLYSSLQSLTTSEPLHLELSIHIVFALTPCRQELLAGTAQAIRNIFSRSSEMNEYVCSKVIDLIGELSPLLGTIHDLLMPMLIFLSNSLMYPSLAPVASMSCCNLLEQVDEQKSDLAQSMQQFLSHAYEILFKDSIQTRVIQNLTKAMTIFIYKFKRNPEDYHNYLNIFHQRCSQLDKNTRFKLIQAAISGQIWINCQSEIKGKQHQKNYLYLEYFGRYVEKQVQFMLESLEWAEKKKEFSETVVLINLCLKTNAVVGNGDIWCHLCDYLLTRYLKVTPPLPIAITPLVNLTKCSIDLQNPSLASSVSLLLNKWHGPSTQLLDFTFKHCEFTLSSTILSFHLKIVQFLKKYPQCKENIDYNPQDIVKYISGIIDRQDVWEYQVFKYGLNYLLVVLQLGYPPKNVLQCLLGAFGRLQQTLWTALDPILVFIYQHYGFDVFNEVLRNLNCPLADRTNPLNALLLQAFEKGDGKTVKNLFLAL